MTKFLLDANLSPETQLFLEKTFGFDVASLLAQQRGQIPDEDVVELAKEQKRVVITFDQDFGEIYHFKEKGKFGAIVLRLEDQTVESVNQLLGEFFTQQQEIDLENSLVILEKGKVRVIKD